MKTKDTRNKERKKIPHLTILNLYFEYNEKTGIIRWKRRCGGAGAWSIAGHKCLVNQRIVIRFRGFLYMAHRIAWALYYNEEPPDSIDHIDLNPFNNKIENLRGCTNQENCRNQGIRSSNTSGHTGVRKSKSGNKWQAGITINYKYMYIGSFIEKSDAIAAVKEAYRKRFGEFASKDRI